MIHRLVHHGACSLRLWQHRDGQDPKASSKLHLPLACPAGLEGRRTGERCGSIALSAAVRCLHGEKPSAEVRALGGSDCR